MMGQYEDEGGSAVVGDEDKDKRFGADGGTRSADGATGDGNGSCTISIDVIDNFQLCFRIV